MDKLIFEMMEAQKGIDNSPLPVMRGKIQPRSLVERHADDELKNFEISKLNANLTSKISPHVLPVLPTFTVASPITHGIAPSLINLKEIYLKEAIERVNTIQSGRVLFVETIKPAYRFTATLLCVCDTNADVMMLNLYNYFLPDEDPQKVFPSGTYLAIMEPYLRFAKNNPSKPTIIRTDNPQTIVVFDSRQAWDEARTAKVRSEEFCLEGNKYFGNNKFHQAIRAYSKGLEIDSESIRILSNRAQAFMNINCWHEALDDIDKVLILDFKHEKCRRRLCTVLLYLQRPQEALETIDQLISEMVDIHSEVLGSTPQKPETKAVLTSKVKSTPLNELESLRNDILRAIREQENGDYDIVLMMEMSKKNECEISRKHMNYKSPCIVIKETANCGRGVRCFCDTCDSSFYAYHVF